MDVVIFAEEEGSRFSRGLLGSSVWTGLMGADQLSIVKDELDISYTEAMARAGIRVDDGRTLQPSDIKAMLEVHIEQGAVLEKNARKKNAASLKMISGAGHDTALVAGLAEAAMIFVPSRDGLSHCPQEFTRMEDIVLGCEILLDTVIEIAA